jgi:hypothetical protein
MTHIIRALVVWVLLFACCIAAFVALWLWSPQRVDVVAAEAPILGGAIAAWFGVQFGRASVKRLRERRAVGRADDVGRPRDGEFVVARGTLSCAAPLATPFSGKAAAAYGYKAWRREKSGPSQKNTWEIAYWWGEGSAPCSLLTRHGSFEVRSRLELELWSSLVENTAAAQAHFAAFMRSVNPDVGTAGIARPGFDWDAPLDGPLRRDKLRQADPPPLGELTLHEWVIAPGEPVVLMGRYSATRGGLVHDDRTGRPLRVLKGDTASVRSQLLKAALGYGALSALALAGATLLAGSILGWHRLGF